MQTEQPAIQPELHLVSLAAAGDLQAFNDLVLKYQDLVYGLAVALLGDHDAAQDAAQETFISAFQHLRGFRGGTLRSWLLRIVRNTCYDVLRASRRHPMLPLFPEDADGREMESPSWLTDQRAGVQAQVEVDELSQSLYRWLDELPAAYRSVITLIDLNGLDYGEAARALKIPVGTVKSRLARARLRIRERLSQDYSLSSDLRIATAEARD